MFMILYLLLLLWFQEEMIPAFLKILFNSYNCDLDLYINRVEYEAVGPVALNLYLCINKIESIGPITPNRAPGSKRPRICKYLFNDLTHFSFEKGALLQ